MRITCWGARGSIAVSGPEYLRFGGDTTCLELRGRSGQLFIIDAGTGARRLGQHLDDQGRVEGHLILTHAHWDHISGFPFFRPVYQESTKLSVICCAFTHKFVREMLESTMNPPYFPLPLSKLKAELDFRHICGERFDLSGLSVEVIPLSHPNGGVGYKFTEQGRSFVFLTDNQLHYRHPNGLDYQDYVRFCQGADLLVHDAEYTPEEYKVYYNFGHSSYTDALDLALASGVGKFALFHHNQNRTDDQLDRIVAECRERARAAGSGMEVLALSVGLSLEI